MAQWPAAGRRRRPAHDAAGRFTAYREAGQAPIQRQAWPFLDYSLPFSPPHAEILPTTANIERSRKPSLRRHPHRQPSAKILAGHLPVTSNSNHHRVFAYLPIGCRNKHIKHCQQQVLLLSRSHKFCEKLHSDSPKKKAATAIVLWQSARARRGKTSRRAIARQRGNERGIDSRPARANRRLTRGAWESLQRSPCFSK